MFHMNAAINYLVLDENMNYVLAGVAPWASVDCQPSEPTGYASVSDVRDWVSALTGL